MEQYKARHYNKGTSIHKWLPIVQFFVLFYLVSENKEYKLLSSVCRNWLYSKGSRLQPQGGRVWNALRGSGMHQSTSGKKLEKLVMNVRSKVMQ